MDHLENLFNLRPINTSVGRYRLICEFVISKIFFIHNIYHAQFSNAIFEIKILLESE